MQLQILINNQLFRTVLVDSDSYNPGDFWPEIKEARDKGLLNGFGIDKGLSIEIKKVE